MKSYPTNEKWKDTFSLDQQETEKIREIIKLYQFVKGLTIHNELIDSEDCVRLEVVEEISAAFEVFNNFLIPKLNDYPAIRAGTDDLDEVYEHMHTAAMKNVDWLYLETVKYTKKQLSSYSNEAINTCFPEYYSDIKHRLYKHDSEIKNLNTSIHKGRDISKYITEFENISNDFLDIRKQITMRLASLMEYNFKEKNQEKNKNKSEFKRLLITGIIAGIALLIIGILLKSG